MEVEVFVADQDVQLGRPVGNGHCVALVQKAAGLPGTWQWRRGQQVRGAELPRGTAIATFNERGRYQSDTSGGSHAAIYLDQDERGLRVIDQWVEHPPAERTIRFRGGIGLAVDDGDRYHVVTT